MTGEPQNREREAAVEATVVELLPSLTYRLELAGGEQVRAHATGEGERNFVRLRPGDRVAVELSPHDPGRGRIIRLLKG